MKKFFNKKYFLIAGDVLLLPAMIFCEWLSDYMLSKPGECLWVILGGKCVTCGGTHFVNSILNGRIIEAFNYNQLLFVITIMAIIVWVLLHLDWFLSIGWAKKALKKVFSIPSLVFWSVAILVFFFARNMNLFIRVAQIIFK